jgi:uncharacterized membrane protein YidH (DUF202 family)
METPPKKVPILKKIFGALDIISAVWMAGPFGFLLTKKTPPNETPPKKAPIAQVIFGALFMLIWVGATGFFWFGFSFTSIVAAFSSNALPFIGKLLMLLSIILGGGLLTIAGAVAGTAIASAEETDRNKNWKKFRWMLGYGLGLCILGIYLIQIQVHKL